MRNLDYYAIMCIRDLEIIGIELGKITKFTVNTRAKTRWGQCVMYKDKHYEININADLLREEIPLDGLKSTIYHELLHTCKDCFNHGKQWSALAARVEKYYGVKVSRTDSAFDKGFTKEQAQAYNESRIKYRFVCAGCGQKINKIRSCDFVKHPERYQCGICHNKFERVA